MQNKIRIMSSGTVGTQVNLLFRARFLTFTPDQFNNAFKEQGYFMSQGQANPSLNPAAKPIPALIFSKGNLAVTYNQNQNTIIFQILNTLDLDNLYDHDITPLLAKLNFVESSTSMMSLECHTQLTTTSTPMSTLTSLVNSDYINGLNKILGEEKLGVTAIRLSTKYPLLNDGMQIVLEPLGNDPERSYYLNIIYRTSEMSKFNDFVRIFGATMIEKIAKEASGNV